MKSYSPRERNGMIVLACIVALCFCIEPLCGLAGCSRAATAGDAGSVSRPASGRADDSIAAAGTAAGEWKSIRKEERSAAHLRSDSIRDVRRDSLRKARRDSARRAKAGRSSGKTSRKSAVPARRSLRDERL